MLKGDHVKAAFVADHATSWIESDQDQLLMPNQTVSVSKQIDISAPAHGELPVPRASAARVPSGRHACESAPILREGSEPWPHIPGRMPVTGDHAILKDGSSIWMIRDAHFLDGASLGGIKYLKRSPAVYEKLPDVFGAPDRYRQTVSAHQARSVPSVGPFGAEASILSTNDMVGTVPSRALSEWQFPLPWLLREFDAAGINVDKIRVSGSRGHGLWRSESDWDMILAASPDQIRALRKRMTRAIEDGRLTVPKESGTWRLFGSQFPGGRETILKEGRFAETVECDGVKVVMIFVPDWQQNPVWDASWSMTRGIIHGVVSDQSMSGYLRASAILMSDSGDPVEFIATHKLANLLKNGDRVSAEGWVLTNGSRTRLLQFYRDTDSIRWHRS